MTISNDHNNAIILPHPANFWVRIFELKPNISSLNSTNLMDRYSKIKSTIQENLHADCQIFLPSVCLSEKHLDLVLFFVEKTFRMKNNISSQPAIEFLLYLSRQRQIKSAIETSGIANAKTKTLPTSFGFIAFGSQKLENVSNEYLGPFLDLYDSKTMPIPSNDELFQWITDHKISESLLRRYLLAYSIPIPSNMGIGVVIHSLQPDMLERILLDILSEQMSSLYLTNQKQE